MAHINLEKNMEKHGLGKKYQGMKTNSSYFLALDFMGKQIKMKTFTKKQTYQIDQSRLFEEMALVKAHLTYGHILLLLVSLPI